MLILCVQDLVRMDQVPNSVADAFPDIMVQDLVRMDQVPNRCRKMQARARRNAAQTWFQNAQIRVPAGHWPGLALRDLRPSRPGGGTVGILAQRGTTLAGLQRNISAEVRKAKRKPDGEIRDVVLPKGGLSF